MVVGEFLSGLLDCSSSWRHFKIGLDWIEIPSSCLFIRSAVDNGLATNLSSRCIWFLYFALELWIISGHVGPDISSTFGILLKAALWLHLHSFPFHSDVLLSSYAETRFTLVCTVTFELRIFFLQQKPRGTRMTMRRNQTRTMTDVRRAAWVCWPGLQPARFLSAPAQRACTRRANSAADRALWVRPAFQRGPTQLCGDRP